MNVLKKSILQQLHLIPHQKEQIIARPEPIDQSNKITFIISSLSITLPQSYKIICRLAKYLQGGIFHTIQPYYYQIVLIN